jgi:hypothetical protein
MCYSFPGPHFGNLRMTSGLILHGNRSLRWIFDGPPTTSVLYGPNFQSMVDRPRDPKDRTSDGHARTSHFWKKNRTSRTRTSRMGTSFGSLDRPPSVNISMSFKMIETSSPRFVLWFSVKCRFHVLNIYIDTNFKFNSK